MSGRKSGKIMNFSQAVIGQSSSRSSKGPKGTWVASSTGMVNGSPSKPSAPSLRGKRVY